jgi:hypothetical protein
MKFKAFLETPIFLDPNYEPPESNYEMSQKADNFTFDVTIPIEYGKSLPIFTPKLIKKANGIVKKNNTTNSLSANDTNNDDSTEEVVHDQLFMNIFKSTSDKSVCKILITTKPSSDPFNDVYITNTYGKIVEFSGITAFSINLNSVRELFRDRRLAILIYINLIKYFIAIRSDALLTPGSFFLWNHLKQNQLKYNINVYAIVFDFKGIPSTVVKLTPTDDLEEYMYDTPDEAVGKPMYKFVATTKELKTSK